MILSEERISHISHKIHDALYLDELIDYKDETRALKLIKQVLNDFILKIDQIDDAVRNRIRSLKRNLVEGMPEWDVMYTKYFEDELNKMGLG